MFVLPVMLVGCGDDCEVAATASFRGLGFLTDEPDAQTRAFGVSADGTTVVGTASSEESLEAFRWTVSGGLQGLGFPPDKEGSEATAANQDGSVIAGNAVRFVGPESVAARWCATTGWELFGGDGFVPIRSLGISADGNTIVGVALSVPGGLRQAFRWTPTGGSERLEPLAEERTTFAIGISADAAVVTGVGGDADGNVSRCAGPATAAPRWLCRCWTWTMTVPASAVSADGSTIVGECGVAASFRAVLWDERGVVALGFEPGGYGSRLQDVSADGTVGVGQAGDAEEILHAAIWTAANGFQDLREVLVRLGLGGAVAGWFLDEANAISADGTVIAGVGHDPDRRTQAYVVTLPPQVLE